MNVLSILAGAGLACTAGAMTLDGLLALDSAPVRMVYKTFGETNLAIQVFAPRESAATFRPAILMIHGGGWSAGGPEQLAPHGRYFASRGLVAISVEYRLAGKTNGVRIADCVADCRDALRFVRRRADRLRVDSKRIAVAGDSAGGHLAAALALLPDTAAGAAERPDALILYNPVVDLAALKWMAGHPGVAALPDSPVAETWKERADRLSPIRFVRPGLPPTLLIHGTADTVVPIEQADRFAEALRADGNRIEFHRMAEWGHAFVIPSYGKPDQIVEALRMTDAFLAELGYLAGEPTLAEAGRPPP